MQQRERGSKPASDVQLRAAWDRADEESGGDDSGDPTAEALATAARGQAPLSPDERRILDELGQWAERRRHLPDTRAEALLAWLTDVCRRPDGGWTDERVIVFTEYRDTQKWLHDLLVNRGFGGDGGSRIALLYGGMDTATRERTKAEFQAHPSRSPVRILVATDAASEGIDLQRHCWRLLQWEIPWNPARLEQRIGRVDRHGQQAATVEVRHFVPAGWETGGSGVIAELGFLSTVALKVEQIRDDLGSVGAVLEDQVSEAMLGQRRRLDDRAVERARSKPGTGVLRVERRLREGLARCHDRLQASIAELGLTPERIERVVATALDAAHQPSLRPGPERGTFWLPELSGAWQRTSEGMVDPLSGDPLPFSFDPAVVGLRDDVVLAHLGHRLVAQAMRLLRAEVWGAGADRVLTRVTATGVPAQRGVREVLAPGDVGLVCHARLVLTGAGGHRLHEEIVLAGGRLRAGRFTRIDAQRDLAALLAAGCGTTLDTGDAVRTVADHWDSVVAPGLGRALERRAEDVQDSKLRDLEQLAEREATSITLVLEDLRAQISRELRDLEVQRVEQLSLFSEPEREQSQRDLDALRRRLDEIPAEIEREVAAIRRRFSDPDSHVFPAAVTILVPLDAC